MRVHEILTAMNSVSPPINFEIERLFQSYLELLDKKDEGKGPNFITFFEDRLKPDPVFEIELRKALYAGRAEGYNPWLNRHIKRAAKSLGAIKRAFARYKKTGAGYESYLLCLVDFKMEYDQATQYQEEAPCESHEAKLAAATAACKLAGDYLTPDEEDFFDFLEE